MATLARLYNNPDVFTGVVKIRKGLTASIMLEISDFESALKYFRMFARQIYGNLEPSDASSGIISDLLEQVLEFDAQTTHDPALSMEGAW